MGRPLFIILAIETDPLTYLTTKCVLMRDFPLVTYEPLDYYCQMFHGRVSFIRFEIIQMNHV